MSQQILAMPQTVSILRRAPLRRNTCQNEIPKNEHHNSTSEIKARVHALITAAVGTRNSGQVRYEELSAIHPHPAITDHTCSHSTLHLHDSRSSVRIHTKPINTQCFLHCMEHCAKQLKGIFTPFFAFFMSFLKKLASVLPCSSWSRTH